MMCPMPTLGKAYSILLRDESQREIQSFGSPFISKSACFSVKSTPTSAQFNNGPKPYPEKVNFDIKRGNLVYKYGTKPGHPVEKCYKLHGFPSDFKFI